MGSLRLARSLNPSLCATASISASISSICFKPRAWISSGATSVVVMRRIAKRCRLLRRRLSQEESAEASSRHRVPADVCGYLIECMRDLMQAGQIVVVVADRHERRQYDQVGKFKLQAVHLIHRHLPMLELCPFNVLAQFANHQFAAEGVWS